MTDHSFDRNCVAELILTSSQCYTNSQIMQSPAGFNDYFIILLLSSAAMSSTDLNSKMDDYDYCATKTNRYKPDSCHFGCAAAYCVRVVVCCDNNFGLIFFTIGGKTCFALHTTVRHEMVGWCVEHVV